MIGKERHPKKHKTDARGKREREDRAFHSAVPSDRNNSFVRISIPSLPHSPILSSSSFSPFPISCAVSFFQFSTLISLELKEEEEEEDERYFSEHLAGLRQPLLLLPRPARTLPPSYQALQEVSRRHFPPHSGTYQFDSISHSFIHSFIKLLMIPGRGTE